MNCYRVTDDYSLDTFVVFAENEREAISKVFEYERTNLLNDLLDLDEHIKVYYPKVFLETKDVIRIIQYS